MKKNKLSSAIQITLGVVTTAIYFPVNAQETSENSNAEKFVEEVTVTGSRIPRAGFDTMQPASSIDKDFFDSAGYTNIGDALNDHPLFAAGGTNLSTDAGGFNVGHSYADFYGLGSQRTLTLVNGRRVVPSNAPSPFGADPGGQVDLNSFPSSMIERVEMVSVGGAPVYGSDAIAGTVNIILKKDFEGAEFEVKAGQAQEGDAEDRSASFLWGTNFDEGRGNVTAAIEWSKSEAVLAMDRDFTRANYWFFDNPDNTGPDDGIPDTYFGRDRIIAVNTTNGIPASAPVAPPLFGRDLFVIHDADGNPVGFNNDGMLVPYQLGTPTGNLVTYVGGDGLNLQLYSSVRSPIEKSSLNIFSNYELTDNITFISEINYYTAESADPVSQPTYLSGSFGTALAMSVNNPYLDEASRTILVNELGADGTFWMNKTMNLVGGFGTTDAKNRTVRAVIGLQGEFEMMAGGWHWDVSVNRGQTTSDTTRTYIIDDRFRASADAQLDDSNNIVCGNGNTDPNCVPINLFGVNDIDPAAVAYVTTRAHIDGELNQTIYSGNIGGNVFDLHGGPFAFSAGLEYREEDGSLTYDDFLQQGLDYEGDPNQNINGDFNTNEAYVEILAPVLGDTLPVLSGIELEASYRFIDHSRAGTDNAWSVGGRFMLDIGAAGSLTLRGNVTESVRSPAITEVLLPRSPIFSFADDPCDRRYVGDHPNRLPACQAEADAMGFAYDPTTFESVIADGSQLGYLAGNPDLVSERAESSTVGFVYKSDFIEGLEVAVDYVDIDIQDAIESLPLEDIMEGCYDTGGTDESCNSFVRGADFQIVDYTSGYRNAGFNRYRGLQFDFSYDYSLGTAGDINARLFISQILENEFSVTGRDINNKKGEIGTADWKGQGGINYMLDDLTISWNFNYIAESVVDNTDLPEARDIKTVDAHMLHHMSVAYDFNEHISARLNIRNLFDEEPPLGQASNSALGVYDLIGRAFSVSVGYKF